MPSLSLGNMDDPENFISQVREHRTTSINHPFICDLHSLEKLKCQKCYFKSDLKVLLTKHFYTFHKAEATERYPNPVLRNCENCDFQTYSSLVLLSHYTCCESNGNTFLEDIEAKSEFENVLTRVPAEDEKSLKRTKIGRFQCDYCSYKTIRKGYLETHMYMKHTPPEQINRFRCEYCLFKTKLNSNLNRHVLAMHPEKVDSQKLKYYKCNHCSYTTIKKSQLREHIFVLHLDIVEPKEPKYKRNRGSNGTTRKGDLKKHISQDPLEPKTHLLIPSELIHWFKCDQCPYKTTSTGDLKAHIHKRHKTSEQINSIKCSYETIKRECSEPHLRQMHASSEQINCFTCEQCPYEAKEKYHLDQHITAMHPKTVESKILKCDHCSYETVRTDKCQDRMKLHMSRNHTLAEQISWSECEYCLFKTRKKCNLNRHVLAVHPEKVEPKKRKHFQCEHCSYTTLTNLRLREHTIVKHTPSEHINYWFNCEFCLYKSKHKRNLNRHVLSQHPQTLKHFKCKQCSYRTVRSGDLKAHMRRMHIFRTY